MTRLRVKNFGPIRDGIGTDGGWIEFRRITIFMGNQGSGKSTLAKLFSTFAWIEKSLTRGDHDARWFERRNKLKNPYLKYHRLENYFRTEAGDDAELEYEGEAWAIRYKHGQLHVEQREGGHYQLPQIMYVPAERNFISYVKSPKELKLSSDALKEFLTEFDMAKAGMKGAIDLPINGVQLDYDKLNDTLNILDAGHKLKLTDASSGFQSLAPLYLVSHHLAKSVADRGEGNQEPMSAEELARFKREIENISRNDLFTEEQQRAALSALSSRFNKTAFLNIVEEPEQNLFPLSQWKILQSLLEFNNQTDGNGLVLTTHSPYIVNYISIAIQGKQLFDKINSSGRGEELAARLGNIVSLKALISADDVAIYQLDEKSGSVTRLPASHGIPSDHNYLNEVLREGNSLFDQLLVLEEELAA